MDSGPEAAKKQRCTSKGVQEKIHCVFESIVVEEPSTKRNFQPYKVIAVDRIRESALHSEISNAIPTEKFDGTCVFIDNYRDVPWLWARHDKKPSKISEKKFKRFQTSLRAWQAGGETGSKPTFQWDPENDFKEVPSVWMPAGGVEVNESGNPLPDEGGHIFGWIPIDPRGRSHLWHASTVDLEAGVCLILQPRLARERGGDEHKVELTLKPLAELVGTTLELIGTNVNANPYRLGSKKQPFHVMIEHGSFHVDKVPHDHKSLSDWFQEPQGQVEGVVWHCPDGHMFKVHRHHLSLKWPVEGPTKLEGTPLIINVNISEYDVEPDSSLYDLGKLHGLTFASINEFSDHWISLSK